MPINRVLLVSTYPPTRCGIATFSWDLVHAIRQADNLTRVHVAAIETDRVPRHYAQEDRPVYHVRNHEEGAWKKLAEFVNDSAYDVVSIQHEYGLFSGEWGEDLLEFLRLCKKPVIATLHTVMKDPPPMPKKIMSEIAQHCSGMVVMVDLAKDMLKTRYGVKDTDIRMIPHGVPRFNFAHRATIKGDLGMEGRHVITTFGLLSRGKGIEYMIEAMREIHEWHPDAVYLVIGRTHPAIKAREGDSYRDLLKARARLLPNPDAIQFVDHFVTIEELARYLQAADAYVTPYVGADQIVSGTLSYALAAGKAIVSTPYLYAIDALADGRGLLAEFRNPKSIAREMLRILGNPDLAEGLERAAYAFAQPMFWPAVAQEYVDFIIELKNDEKTSTPS